MKAALALIFFACVAGSMAADARSQLIQQLVEQGQVIAQGVFGQLQQQVLALAQQAIGQLSTLIGSFGRFDFEAIIAQFKPLVNQYINQALAGVLGSLQGLIGGRASFDFGAIFNGLLEQVTKPLTEMGQHILNQGLAAVLGSFGSRGIADLFAGLQQQIGTAVSAAQGALTGALSNLASLGSSILDASKPHWEQLQEQLIGHGLNALGSISETIGNLHGTITGGR